MLGIAAGIEQGMYQELSAQNELLKAEPDFEKAFSLVKKAFQNHKLSQHYRDTNFLQFIHNHKIKNPNHFIIVIRGANHKPFFKNNLPEGSDIRTRLREFASLVQEDRRSFLFSHMYANRQELFHGADVTDETLHQYLLAYVLANLLQAALIKAIKAKKQADKQKVIKRLIGQIKEKLNLPRKELDPYAFVTKPFFRLLELNKTDLMKIRQKIAATDGTAAIDFGIFLDQLEGHQVLTRKDLKEIRGLSLGEVSLSEIREGLSKEFLEPLIVEESTAAPAVAKAVAGKSLGDVEKEMKEMTRSAKRVIFWYRIMFSILATINVVFLTTYFTGIGYLIGFSFLKMWSLSKLLAISIGFFSAYMFFGIEFSFKEILRIKYDRTIFNASFRVQNVLASLFPSAYLKAVFLILASRDQDKTPIYFVATFGKQLEIIWRLNEKELTDLKKFLMKINEFYELSWLTKEEISTALSLIFLRENRLPENIGVPIMIRRDLEELFKMSGSDKQIQKSAEQVIRDLAEKLSLVEDEEEREEIQLAARDQVKELTALVAARKARMQDLELAIKGEERAPPDEIFQVTAASLGLTAEIEALKSQLNSTKRDLPAGLQGVDLATNAQQIIADIRTQQTIELSLDEEKELRALIQKYLSELRMAHFIRWQSVSPQMMRFLLDYSGRTLFSYDTLHGMHARYFNDPRLDFLTAGLMNEGKGLADEITGAQQFVSGTFGKIGGLPSDLMENAIAVVILKKEALDIENHIAFNVPDEEYLFDLIMPFNFWPEMVDQYRPALREKLLSADGLKSVIEALLINKGPQGMDENGRIGVESTAELPLFGPFTPFSDREMRIPQGIGSSFIETIVLRDDFYDRLSTLPWWDQAKVNTARASDYFAKDKEGNYLNSRLSRLQENEKAITDFFAEIKGRSLGEDGKTEETPSFIKKIKNKFNHWQALRALPELMSSIGSRFLPPESTVTSIQKAETHLKTLTEEDEEFIKNIVLPPLIEKIRHFEKASVSTEALKSINLVIPNLTDKSIS